MRGRAEAQAPLFSYVSMEERIPANHPLRTIKREADAVLKELSPVFTAMYSAGGRPSIPPERLLKSQVLIALYSVRSDRLFCEQLEYNLLFRWFLDLELEEPAFDASTFSKNRERLLAHDVAPRFLDAVVRRARRQRLLSDEHFTVDGTLLQAWASMKSVRPTDAAPPPPSRGPGNPTVDWRGQRRTNATHRSITDPQARLVRKAKGQAAILGFLGHALMDNRHGLCTDFAVTPATGTAEREAATALLARPRRKRLRPKTLGADKGYHASAFVAHLRAHGIAPHIAQVATRTTPGLDGRTTRHASYRLSQRKRKRVEEIFGWLKPVAGLRKARFRGVARIEQQAHLAVAAYNLVRIAHLQPALESG